jgi:hypothetical protein
MAVNFSHPINPLIQFNLATAEDQEKITVLEISLTERLKTLDATTVSACKEFLAAVADDSTQLRKLRHRVKKRLQEFMAVRHKEWLKTVEDNAGAVLKYAERPCFEKAMEGHATCKEKEKGKKRKTEDSEARFREVIEELKTMHRELCLLGFALSARVEKRLNQVKQEAEQELKEVEGWETTAIRAGNIGL